jgi:hypothetical protein
MAKRQGVQVKENTKLSTGSLAKKVRELQVETNKRVEGLAKGYKVGRGQLTTSTASDTVVTGLATVVAVVATLDDDPVAGCQFVTASRGNQAGAPAAGSVLIKTWKDTATADTTKVAATTFGKKVNWIAWGT